MTDRFDWIFRWSLKYRTEKRPSKTHWWWKRRNCCCNSLNRLLIQKYWKFQWQLEEILQRRYFPIHRWQFFVRAENDFLRTQVYRHWIKKLDQIQITNFFEYYDLAFCTRCWSIGGWHLINEWIWPSRIFCLNGLSKSVMFT